MNASSSPLTDDAGDGMPERRHIFSGALGLIIVIVLLCMSLFETATHYFWPGWISRSHIATVLFSTIIAGIGGYLALRRIDLLQRGLMKEISERKRVEASTRSLNEELEQRVAARTVEIREKNDVLRQQIAERKETEAALIREKEAARRYLNVAGVMFIVLDHDGRVQLINRAGCQILGYAEEEILGKNWFEHFLPPDQRDPVAHVFQDLIEGRIESARYYENPVLNRNGQVRLIAWHNTVIRDDAGHIVATLGSGTDITEREQAVAALRESEARFRTILETTVDGIITIDEAGSVESFNTASERIFGYKAAEVLGRNVGFLMPAPYADEHDGYLRNYLETGHRKIIGIGREVSGMRKDGTVFPLDLSVSEVRLPDRRIFTGIVRDITERQRLEQEILRVSDQERRRIGQDLHDGLGQMLTGIGLISQHLARQMKAADLPGAEEAAEITELIREADQYARSLSRGLVPVELEANGLATALSRLATNAERLFRISCIFEKVGTIELPGGSVASHLYRIAQEAVSNAVKHGKATQVKIILVLGNEQLGLRVQDNGIGFPDILPEERGMGVRTMHYRAHIIGATLKIRRGLDSGTTLSCMLRHAG